MVDPFQAILESRTPLRLSPQDFFVTGGLLPEFDLEYRAGLMDGLPEKYLEGIRLFNEEEFFECHDVLEELWSETMGDERSFLQGLIQASVALFHFGNGNLGGARKLFDSAWQRLGRYPTPYMGIDLLQFMLDFEQCFRELLDAGSNWPEGIELRDDRIPVIRMVEQVD